MPMTSRSSVTGIADGVALRSNLAGTRCARAVKLVHWCITGLSEAEK